MKNSKWLALLLVFVLVSAFMPPALAADYVEPFTDVSVKQYYAEPVSWAVAQEITNGVSKTEFAPDKTCTRAEGGSLLRSRRSPRPLPVPRLTNRPQSTIILCQFSTEGTIHPCGF